MLVRLAKIAAGFIAAGVAGVCLLLFTMWWEHTTTVRLPAPTGSFAVGRTLMAWKAPATREPLAIWVWYPATASIPQQTAEYLPANWRQGLRAHQSVLMRSFFKRDPAVVRTNSRSDAAWASERRTYPLVVLRPGGSALTADFSVLAEDLASHGYVVVGFDAPGRSFVFVEPGGRVIGRAPSNNVENANGNLADPVVGRLLAMWVSDAKAVVDHLQQLNDGVGGSFAGRLDFARVGAVGHSFGGATALQFCHEDSRCRAAIDLDGIPFGSVVTDGLAKPAMFLLSDHSREMSSPESQKVTGMIESIYKRLPTPRIHATIRTANHFSFGDQILLNSQAAVGLLRLTGLGSLDADRGLVISNDYVRTFFDVTMNGRAASTLKRLSERYPEVTVAEDPAAETWPTSGSSFGQSR
jgi:pimeloyl-ACP methyl ester carboxylesterase